MYTVKVIIQMQQDNIVTTGYSYEVIYMAYRITPTISNDLQSYSPTASLDKCDFACSCTSVDKVSTHRARHTVIAQLLVHNQWY